MLEVFKQLGSKHVLVVSSDDGLDEISISAPTLVGELKDGGITTYQVSPEDFGMPLQSDYSVLQIDSVEESLALLRKALRGEHQVGAEIVALNAGAAIYAAGLADSLAGGVVLAQETIASGKAVVKLEELVSFTQSLAG